MPDNSREASCYNNKDKDAGYEHARLNILGPWSGVLEGIRFDSLIILFVSFSHSIKAIPSF